MISQMNCEHYDNQPKCMIQMEGKSNIIIYRLYITAITHLWNRHLGHIFDRTQKCNTWFIINKEIKVFKFLMDLSNMNKIITNNWWEKHNGKYLIDLKHIHIISKVLKITTPNHSCRGRFPFIYILSALITGILKERGFLKLIITDKSNIYIRTYQI